MVENTPKGRELTALQEQVLGYVDSEGPVSVADVAGSLMVRNSSARSALNSLSRRGLLDSQYVGHHRGRGRAYVTTDRGATLTAEVFSADDAEGSDEPVPVRLYGYRSVGSSHGAVFSRITKGTVSRYEREVTWDLLSPVERAAVEEARANGGSAAVGHVTVAPGKRLGVVEEWWAR